MTTNKTKTEKGLDRLAESCMRLGWRYAMAGYSLEEAIADWHTKNEKTTEQLQEKRTEKLLKERSL